MKIKITTGFIIMIGVFSILFTWLKLIDLWYTEENDKILLVTAIGLIGAILGGSISGGLTLMGVRMTINENRENELLTSIPPKTMLIDEIVTTLRKFRMEVERNELLKIKIYLRNPDEQVINMIKENNLLEKASRVNIVVYQSMRKLNEKHSRDNLYNYVSADFDAVKGSIDDCEKALIQEKEKLHKKLENY